MSESLTILVVDDNPSMANTLADILQAKGFEVLAAYSGAEALEILQAHPVDILLTDVRMPDMDGVALYQETRKIRPNLITLLMTAYEANDIIQKGMAEGIRTVLSKPVNIDLLLSLFSVYKSILTKAG